MKLKYKCLILDHDDTAVRSTPEIHYPSFAAAVNLLRPRDKTISLEEFVLYCFDPGFAEFCRDVMKFNPAEQERQYAIWKEYTERVIPDFYPGVVEILHRYKEAGGIITVVSHSEKDKILRDYKEKCGLTPELVFGWEQEEEKRKPHPYPALEILKFFGLQSEEVLLVDDLKPGILMAKSCRIPCAYAGWAHAIPEIEEYMRRTTDFYFPTVESFRNELLSPV